MWRSALVVGVGLLCAASAQAQAQAPSADQIVERARALGLGSEAEQLRSRFLPGARLVPGGAARRGGMRLGGRPDMPRRLRWPSCRGHRLAFLMQIDLTELARAAPGQIRGSGRLLVFGDLRRNRDGVAGMEYVRGRLIRPGLCVQLRHVTAPPQQLVRRRTPRRTRTLRSTPVTLRPTLTVPSSGVAYTLLPHELGADDEFRWDQLSAEAAAGALGGLPVGNPHRLLGWGAPVSADPGYACSPSSRRLPSRRLLAQLGFDERLRFALGEAGVLFLTMRASDLRAGRFTRVCAEMQG